MKQLATAIYDLIHAIIVRDRLLRQIRDNIQSNHEEILIHMVSQEQRLQAILAGVQDALARLAALKTNNPDIEDEISAIEGALAAGANSPAPTEPPA